MGRAIGIQSPVGKAKVDPQPTARAEPSDIKREIVDRARAGDPEALANLYDWYLPRVYRYVLGRVGNVMEAEDLTEEIFLKMLISVELDTCISMPLSFLLSVGFCKRLLY